MGRAKPPFVTCPPNAELHKQSKVTWFLSNQTLARSFRVRLSWGCKARHFHHISICPLSLLSQASSSSKMKPRLEVTQTCNPLAAHSHCRMSSGRKVRRLMAKPQTYFLGVIADPSYDCTNFCHNTQCLSRCHRKKCTSILIF